MFRSKKLIASLVIMGMSLQMIPVGAVEMDNNSVTPAPPKAFGPVPSSGQLQYHEEELAAFIHFGMNTFTNSEWGNGRENPNSFNPTDLDPEQWVKTLKDAGFKRLIMVGKHHDGFAIWKSEYTTHDIESSTDWQNKMGGKGDVLEEISKACTKYDMDMGIYLSPWDVNATSYGYGSGTNEETDTNGDYNEYYMNQLREILGNSKYGNNGRFVEVWMDGAKGSGAAAQNYKFQEWFDLIEELQPGAVVFSPYATGVRWIGNESGKAGDPVWSKINKKRIIDRYDAGLGEENSYLNNGDPNGDIWSVGECDVSLTSGWFWHNGNNPKTMDQLTDIYFSSVGRGQPLLLNVAPDNQGKFTDNDITRIKEFGDAIKNTFKESLIDKNIATATASSVRGSSESYNAAKAIDDDKETYWTMDDGQTTGSLTIDLGGEKNFDVVSIEEYIKLGQRISEFKVEVFSNGIWKDFGKGYTIGAKRLVRGSSVKASKVRITIEESLDTPLINNVEVYKADKAFAIKSIAPEGTDFIDNVSFENKDSWIQENIGIGNTGMYSNTTGKHTSFTFTGSKAWVIGTFDPGHGIMEVYVDDKKVADVDTYKATRAISQIIYATDDLEYGTHTVKVVIKGQKNQSSSGNYIGIDGAYYLNNNGAGMFEIERGSYTVNEGESQEITIKRVGGSKGVATVHFSTSPDSGVHGRHYKDINKTIEFADGQTEAKVSIEAIENDEKSGDLRFYCSIDTPSSNAILGFNTEAVVIIKDNDIDAPDTEKNAEMDIIAPESVKVGENFELKLNAKNLVEDKIYAMEFNVDYDKTKVDFVQAISADDSKYIVTAVNNDNSVKVVVATKGVAIANVEDIIKLNFKAKATGKDITFNLVNGKIADEDGKELEVSNSSTKISILESQVSVEADKTLLGLFINYAEDAKKNGALENVVPAVVKEFEDVLKEAKEIFENKNATEAQVDLTSRRLINAIHMLDFKKGDKTELTKLVEIVNTLEEVKYTTSTWDKLQGALKEANKVLADENAMQEEVSKVHEKLMDAMNKLELSSDKSKLEKLVTELEGKDLSKYTKGTVSKFNSELANAKAVLANKDASQKEIDEAYNKLIKAYLDLRLIPDKSKLEELLNKAQAIDTSKYTKASVYRFNSHLANVKAVLNNEEATQKQVDQAQKGLELAMANLELAQGGTVNNGNTDKENNNTNNSVNNDDSNKEIAKGDSQQNSSNNSSSTASTGKGNVKLPSTGGTSSVVVGAIALLIAGIGSVLRKRK